jgi:rfaE bifunctional protein kinase chain/domain
VVFVHGYFNIIHPGHLRLLRFARECGDRLVVGVLDDRSPGAMVPSLLRLEGILSISWVDHAFVLHDPPERFIEALEPAYVVKGKEHEEKSNPERPVLDRYGGKLLFGSGDISFSSLDLIRREWEDITPSTIVKPPDFPARHGFRPAELHAAIEGMKSLKICVVGDVIVDEFISCDPLGMSQEDPTIVVTPIMEEKFIGGAAIVAAHARGLGAQTVLFSAVGRDETAAFLRGKMEGEGVELRIFEDESRPTTLKQRFVAGQKTLLRVSHLRQHGVSDEIRRRMRDDLMDMLEGIDVLLFADFNYGCLPQVLVDEVIAFCREKGIMMVADSQSSSQIGDVSRFTHMSLLTPTEREARLAVRDSDSGLVVLAEKLRHQAKARNVIVTLGGEGILIHAETNEDNRWLTDRLPAMNSAPKNVMGAGDSLLTCASMAFAVTSDIWRSCYLGSLAAACQVGRMGNIPLTAAELKMELDA